MDLHKSDFINITTSHISSEIIYEKYWIVELL